MTNCPTCLKTSEQLKRRTGWECSHVECPNRRRAVVVENVEPTGNRGSGITSGRDGIVDCGSDGCYRRTPTSRE